MNQIITSFDPVAGHFHNVPSIERYVSDLRDCFADAQAYAAALAAGNPLLYTVSHVTPAHGEGALHNSITRLLPGRIGDEYYMTKGHFHAWRPAAEYYIGLRGSGMILLEDERSGDCWQLPFTASSVAYIPGYTAHRTVNTGDEPLVFLGVYPAAAGHDYATIAQRNFRQLVIAVDGKPTVIERATYLRGGEQSKWTIPPQK